MTDRRWSHIRFEMELPGDDSEPDAYIRTYHGTIMGWPDDDEDALNPTKEFGTVTVKLVERDRVINDGESLLEVMDCDSAELCEMYEDLVGEGTAEWKDSVRELLDENRAMYPHFMLIELIELKPQYRGRGIGPEVMLRLIQTLGSSCDLIACKPFPLQYSGWEGKPDKVKMDTEAERARKIAWFKVQGIWEKTGFVPVADSEYYVWPD
jgi:GNAT superfamily N-acetyltransferase